MKRYLLQLLACLILCSTFTACVTQGKPGTPLPPPNKEIGKKWPPEVREFVDAMLMMFVDGKPTPSEGEIERALKMEIGYRSQLPGTMVLINAKIAHWPLGTSNGDDWSDYVKMEADEDGRQSIRLSLYVNTKRYCINPYDFAIYTGHHYFPTFASDNPHDEPQKPLHDVAGKRYGYDYVWGMFDRSPDRLYHGSGGQGNEEIGLSEDQRCITWLRIGAFFKRTESNQNKE